MSSHAKGFASGYKRDAEHADFEERVEIGRVRRKRKQAKHFISKFIWFCVVRECQLYRGEEKYHRVMAMTTKELRMTNAKLSNQFFTRLAKDEDTRLWYWKEIDPKGNGRLIGNLYTHFEDQVFNKWDVLERYAVSIGLTVKRHKGDDDGQSTQKD